MECKGNLKMKLFYFNISKGMQCIIFIKFHSQIPKKVQKYYCGKPNLTHKIYQTESDLLSLIDTLAIFENCSGVCIRTGLGGSIRDYEVIRVGTEIRRCVESY
ncbi:Hypothetical_protein [Hexamita inflata]|uniref:Hypothetical_protein n=1 Tax=Hexamita inflata TaxID=28002 RepID=A0ABP1J6I2_9EUKA